MVKRKIYRLRLILFCVCRLLGCSCAISQSAVDLPSCSSSPPDGAAATSEQQKHRKDHLRLDFSGKIETHILGPTATASNQASSRFRPPVVNLPRGSVSLFGGANYDFSKRWFGATRLFTTLRWWQPSLDPPPREQTQRAFALLPATIDLTREQGLLLLGKNDDAATQVACRWQRTSSQSESVPKFVPADLRIRLADSGSASCSLSIPFHRRVRWQGCLVNDAKKLACPARRNHAKTGGRRGQDESDDDWWIPNVRVDALGQMESTNEAWGMGGRVGMMLKVRRRLNWTALGFAGGGADSSAPETTQLRLEMKHLGSGEQSLTTVCVESELERPLESAHLTIKQDVAVGNSF